MTKLNNENLNKKNQNVSNEYFELNNKKRITLIVTSRTHYLTDEIRGVI